MKVAAIQMVSGTDVQGNLAAAAQLLAAAAQDGAELAVLPEYFCVLGRVDTDKLRVRESFGDGAIQGFLADMARKLKLWIVGGTLPLALPNSTLEPLPYGHLAKVHNASLVFSPDGVCVARYDKIHLFQFDNGQEQFDEARTLQAGKLPQLFTLASRDGSVWRIGLSVCYDLRFPELYRYYAAQNADLLLVPSAFTYSTGQAHWDILLRARAIENQAFVVAAAQGGLHENGRQTWGHSAIVGPWGEVIAQLPADAGVVCCELDIAGRQACANKIPALAHRVL